MIEIICIQERLGEQWIAPSSVAAVNKDEEGEEKEGSGCAALEAINSLGGVIILLPHAMQSLSIRAPAFFRAS